MSNLTELAGEAANHLNRAYEALNALDNALNELEAYKGEDEDPTPTWAAAQEALDVVGNYANLDEAAGAIEDAIQGVIEAAA